MDLLKMKNLLASVADPGSPGGGGGGGGAWTSDTGTFQQKCMRK